MILLVYSKKMHINLASIIYHKYGECKEILDVMEAPEHHR